MRLEREGEFWEIDLDDRSYAMRTGRIGTRDQRTGPPIVAFRTVWSRPYRRRR